MAVGSAGGFEAPAGGGGLPTFMKMRRHASRSGPRWRSLISNRMASRRQPAYETHPGNSSQQQKARGRQRNGRRHGVRDPIAGITIYEGLLRLKICVCKIFAAVQHSCFGIEVKRR